MFNIKAKDTYYFFDEDKKIMLRRNPGWEPDGDHGEGEGLWRTGLAYIAYGKEIIKKGILECYRPFDMINRETKQYYQAMRSTGRYREDDVSRDQTIMSLAALKFNGDEKELKEIALKLPYRISRRFKMGPAMWFWLRAITGSKKANTLFTIFELIEFPISILMTKLFKLILKTNKIYSQEEYFAVDDSKGFWFYDGKDYKWLNEKGVNNSIKMHGNYKKKIGTNKIYKFLDTIQYPGYATHLTGWMIYTMRKGRCRKLLQKLLLWASDKNNLLMRLLAEDNVTPTEINNYISCTGYEWSKSKDGTNYSTILEGDDVLFNEIDRDILITIWNKNNKS